MPSKKPWIVAAGLVLAVGVALVGCQKPAPPPSKPAASRTVTVVQVAPRSIEGGLVASGTLVPREEAAIFSDLTGYRVAKVLTDEGQWVHAGQPVAMLDDTLLRAQIDQQTALAAQLKVQAERAESEAARVKDLDSQGILSQEQIDARRFAARAARAQANAQEAAARDLRTRDARMTMRAPFAGLVIERNVRAGDPSGGTNPYFRIAQDGQIELAADVAEDALSKLRVGGHVDVTLADGSLAPGTIRLVSPRVDTNTKLGRIRVALPVRSNIHAGGFARASFEGQAAAPLTVPETAVRYDADGASVMTVGKDNRVSRVPVVGGQRGSGYVELLKGPPAGSWVVEKASAMLVPGDLVRAIQKTDTPAAVPAKP